MVHRECTADHSAGKFSEDTLEEIRRAPEVAYVERNQIVTTIGDYGGVDLNSESSFGDDTTVESGAPWGLARISHRESLRLGTMSKYVYDTRGGEGVTAYVIDTGINIKHVEFEGRARWGKTIPKNDLDIDGNGHGTHCAGTVGSRKYGVAKKSELVAVKVLGTNGSGTMSDVIDGVLWAAEETAKSEKAADAEVATKGSTKYKGSVANMSLGGGKAQSLDDAIEAAVEVGLHFAVAAGNDNKDACNYSPASAETAITVGASTLRDDRAYFSNTGKCVDVFGPGLNILSTWIGSDRATNTISGTSMASPHVCGLLSYLLSLEGTDGFHLSVSESALELEAEEPSLYSQAYSLLPDIAQKFLPTPDDTVELRSVAPVPPRKKVTPAALKKAVLALATPGALTDVGRGSPNLLIFNNATEPAKKRTI
jgi:cerevisin